jgi:hypothetical protein
MSAKARKRHRKVYETAGQMIRDGLWSVEYAAFHYSEVTKYLRGTGC